MKKAPNPRAPDADDDGVQSPARAYPPAMFRLMRCSPCEYGAKRAEATIEIAGLGEITCDYFVPTKGREPFAPGRSVRSTYTGAYERSVRFDAAFAVELRAAIEARLEKESPR